MRRPRRVPKTPVPPTVRRAGHRALPRIGARRRIAPPSRARPRATACRPLHARPTSGPRGLPRAAAQWPSRIRPHFARDRDVALGALAVASTALPRDLRRGTSGTFQCRHRRRTPVQRRPRGASDCGGLYHAVITAALTACLADPCRHWPERRFSAPSLPDSGHVLQRRPTECHIVHHAARSDGARTHAGGRGLLTVASGRTPALANQPLRLHTRRAGARCAAR